MPDYLVKVNVCFDDANEKHDTRERIIRAKNEAAALKHVVADTITIDRATIDDAVRLSKLGIDIEQAAT